MATFSTRFLGCKVSFADAQAIRERLLADGHDEVPEGGEIQVVNTCCVTHEAVSKSRQAASRAARTARTVYVTGCASNLEGAFATARAERRRHASNRRRGGGVRRRGRRRDRLRERRAPARSRARVREDPGRLLVLVRVLRDPARARRDAEPDGRGRARRDPPPRRAGASRDRAHGRQPRLLPRPCGGLHARPARPRGGGDARPRAPAPLVDRGQPRRRRPRGGAGGDADRLAAPPRPAPVGRRRRAARDGAPVHGRAVRAAARAARRAQPDDRRDRRLPGRGRRGVRADARRSSSGSG